MNEENTAQENNEVIDNKVENLAAAQVKALTEENASLKDRLLRTAAEMENLRKRAERERDDTAKYAVSGFARDLVSVAENLRRALDNIPPQARAADAALNTLGEGVEMTLKELLAAFERHGIRRLNPLGEKFDHNFHQAVAQIETPDTPPGHVAQVMAAGYAIHDRLLKPAMVGVAKAPGAAEAAKAVDESA